MEEGECVVGWSICIFVLFFLTAQLLNTFLFFLFICSLPLCWFIYLSGSAHLTFPVVTNARFHNFRLAMLLSWRVRVLCVCALRVCFCVSAYLAQRASRGPRSIAASRAPFGLRHPPRSAHVAPPHPSAPCGRRRPRLRRALREIGGPVRCATGNEYYAGVQKHDYGYMDRVETSIKREG